MNDNGLWLQAKKNYTEASVEYSKLKIKRNASSFPVSAESVSVKPLEHAFERLAQRHWVTDKICRDLPYN